MWSLGVARRGDGRVLNHDKMDLIVSCKLVFDTE